MFSLNQELITKLIHETLPSYQGICPQTYNLGFGFIFYALTRNIRPQKVVVIGSKAGFSPITFALAIKDNEGSIIDLVDCYNTKLKHPNILGHLWFVDPSFSAERGDQNHWYGIGRWDDSKSVEELWKTYNVNNIITHYKMTSQEFLKSEFCPNNIDILYIDGDHSYEGIKHDFIEFYDKLANNAIVLAHDVDPDLSKEIDVNCGGFEAFCDLPADYYEKLRLPIFPGLAILTKKSKIEEIIK